MVYVQSYYGPVEYDPDANRVSVCGVEINEFVRQLLRDANPGSAGCAQCQMLDELVTVYRRILRGLERVFPCAADVLVAYESRAICDEQFADICHLLLVADNLRFAWWSM